jgi:IS5 family transposase
MKTKDKGGRPAHAPDDRSRQMVEVLSGFGDKAYDSAELRDELDERGTKPVIPNRCQQETTVQVQ